MIGKWALGFIAGLFLITSADARVVRLEVQRREPILDGKAFGVTGSYEKLVGKVHFALDPKAAINQRIVDLKLAPQKRARAKSSSPPISSCSSPSIPKRGNHRLFYEVGNRGGKSMLRYFQKAKNSKDPTSAEEIGDGALMNQGWTLLWMGWQWDVPHGPDAHGHAHRHRSRQKDHRSGPRQFHSQRSFAGRSRWPTAIISPIRSTTPTRPKM